MQKLFIFLGMTILGWVGWRLGEFVSLTTAYWLSGVGSLAGVVLGWKLARKYF